MVPGWGHIEARRSRTIKGVLQPDRMYQNRVIVKLPNNQEILKALRSFV